MAVGFQHVAPAGEAPQQIAERFLDLAFHAAGLDQHARRRRQRQVSVRAVACSVRSADIADAAARDVDDALERQVVGRLRQHAHIGDGVADLGAFVEAQAADDAVRNAERDQPLLEGAGLEAGAHQHSDLRQRMAVAAQRLDAFAHHAGLLVGVPQADDGDLFAVLRIVPARAQRLAQAAFVVRDQRGGGGKDRCGGAVVGFQADDLRARKSFSKRRMFSTSAPRQE